ncbi:hypothetical protein ACFYTC_44835 [Actinomadura nitritigenes]
MDAVDAGHRTAGGERPPDQRTALNSTEQDRRAPSRTDQGGSVSEPEDAP